MMEKHYGMTKPVALLALAIFCFLLLIVPVSAADTGTIAWTNAYVLNNTAQAYTWTTSVSVINATVVVLNPSSVEVSNLSQPNVSGSSSYTVTSAGIWTVRLYNQAMSLLGSSTIQVSLPKPFTPINPNIIDYPNLTLLIGGFAGIFPGFIKLIVGLIPMFVTLWVFGVVLAIVGVLAILIGKYFH